MTGRQWVDGHAGVAFSEMDVAIGPADAPEHGLVRLHAGTTPDRRDDVPVLEPLPTARDDNGHPRGASYGSRSDRKDRRSVRRDDVDTLVERERAGPDLDDMRRRSAFEPRARLSERPADRVRGAERRHWPPVAIGRSTTPCRR